MGNSHRRSQIFLQDVSLVDFFSLLGDKESADSLCAIAIHAQWSEAQCYVKNFKSFNDVQMIKARKVTNLTMYMSSCFGGMTTAFPLCAISDLSISAKDSWIGQSNWTRFYAILNELKLIQDLAVSQVTILNAGSLVISQEHAFSANSAIHLKVLELGGTFAG